MKHLPLAYAAALACTLSIHGGTALAESSNSKGYAPGVADIMIATQVRHAKLWLAGDARNWELADYEIDELKEGLEDIVKYFPVYKDVPVGQMIEATIMAPIKDVEAAVKAKDRAKFTARSTSSPRPAILATRARTGRSSSCSARPARRSRTSRSRPRNKATYRPGGTNMTRGFVTRALLGLCLFLAAGSATSAQEDVAAFYKGKTIRLMVGIGVGSGYDINARLLARHLAAHIPGQPTIVVQNQPGAGSLTMTNALYNNGPFDGTVIGASFNGMPTTPLLQPAGVRFDPVKLNWLGSTNRETQVSYVWHTAPVQKLEDVKATQIVMGAQAPGSTQFDYPMLANSLFGFKFKVVTGYESTPKIHLAMESGEVHGTIANWSTLKAINTNWINEKKIRILAQWALNKHPELGDVPFFFDLAQTDAERAALRLMLARLEYGRPFFLPPNVPAARVEALRRAFDATMKDKAYLAEADKLKIEVDPLTGEQVARLVEQVSRTPAETVARVRAAMEKR